MSRIPSSRLAVVALAAAVGCSEAPNEVESDLDRPLDPSSVVAFENLTELGPTIYVMNVDGSGMKRLTPLYATSQSWSTDGSRLVFSSTKNPDYDLFTMQADGSNVVRLTNTPTILETEPSWSPDGTRIVYRAGVGGELWTISSSGADARLLTPPGTRGWKPAWSPDGSRIAFATTAGVMLIRPDGTGMQHIGPDVPVGDPAWSPDGRRIAYIVGPDKNTDIYSMRADGTDVRRLTDFAGYETDPSWSPDGAFITFATDRDIAWYIFTMRADGSEATKIPNQGLNNIHPKWRPRAN